MPTFFIISSVLGQAVTNSSCIVFFKSNRRQLLSSAFLAGKTTEETEAKE